MALNLKERLVAWMGALLCFAYLVPNHYSPWLSVHQELGAAVAFVPVLVWAGLKGNNSRIPFLAVAVVTLACIPLLQLVCGRLSFSSDGWMAALYLMGFVLSLHAGSSLVARDSHSSGLVFSLLALFWTGIVVAALLSVGIQLYQWLLPGSKMIYIADLPLDWRPFGNIAQPNQLATLLLTALAGMLFLWELARVRTNFAVVASLVLIFGLVMTGSRSVLLALAWFLPAYILLRHRCNLRITPLSVAALTSFYLLSSLSWAWMNKLLLLNGNVSAAVDRMSSPGIRWVFWKSMVDAVGRSPWAGYGWGQIGTAQTETALDYPATYSFFDSSHNLFLDLALWNGLPVAIALSAMLVAWFAWQIYKCRDSLSFALLVAVGFIFSHAMVEFPLNYAYFLLPAGLLMGVLSALHPSPLDVVATSRSAPLIKGVMVVLSAATFVLFINVIIEYFPFEKDWSLMQLRERRIGNLEPNPPPSANILTGLHEFSRFSQTEAKPGMADEEVDWMRKMSERYAYSSVMYKYALSQALNGRSDGAKQTLRRLCLMQTPRACESARNGWKNLAQSTYPQLDEIPFPP